MIISVTKSQNWKEVTLFPVDSEQHRRMIKFLYLHISFIAKFSLIFLWMITQFRDTSQNWGRKKKSFPWRMTRQILVWWKTELQGSNSDSKQSKKSSSLKAKEPLVVAISSPSKNTLDRKSGDSPSQEKLVVSQTYVNKHYVNPPWEYLGCKENSQIYTSLPPFPFCLLNLQRISNFLFSGVMVSEFGVVSHYFSFSPFSFGLASSQKWAITLFPFLV